MKILPRRLLIQVGCGLILIILAFSLPVSSPVRADMGVQPILPGGNDIKPEDETPIQMAAETVVMTVRLATEADNAAVELNPQAYGLDPSTAWYPAVAEVQADFTMKNPTGEAVSMTAWFPLASTLEIFSWELNPDEIVPSITSFQVSVDGDPLEYTVSELPNPKGEDKPLLPWASFPVTFPAEKETNIHISYLLPLEPPAKGNEMSLYYIFQTGAGWAGPIGQAELILNLPYPASAETVAGIPASAFNPPYVGGIWEGGEIPAGVVLEGNQARWKWTDFEPGPEDDFSIRLIQPDKWQAIEEVRAAVQENPSDWQAWLNLAYLYHSMATSFFNTPLIFSSSYLPLGVEAYQKVVELLPEHPAAHAGLALLTLAPYMREKNAPQEVMQFVQDEFETARELEAKYPELGEEPQVNSWTLEDVLNDYHYNEATATAEWATWSADWATETAVAAATFTPEPTETSIPTEKPSLMPTTVPSATPQPLPAATPPAAAASGGQGMILSVAAIVIVTVVVGVLIVRRIRGVR